ncbi:MAG: glucokinase [Gemmatimonadales bacterium]|jgi:glucokinase
MGREASSSDPVRVLAGDVGGTHTRLALVELHDNRATVVRREEFGSASQDGLGAPVREFLGRLDAKPERASFGLACPIVDGTCSFPNLDWTVELDTLRDEIGIQRTGLVNDFDAVAHALPYLGDDDTETLQEGSEHEGAPVACIGPGTGLGQAFVSYGDGRPRIHSSEGGHVDFAPRDEGEAALLEFLRKKYGRVSCERVVSGPGLVDIYRHLAGPDAPTAAEISRRAIEGGDEHCSRVLDLFVSVFGATAGNFALTVQARGGVYLAGGISPKILPRLRNGPFLSAFRAKGRFEEYMKQIPVRVVTNPDVGLIGAAAAAPSE